ncbi:hypothetical protein GCM10025861_18270 [Methanobacterium petrolearium]|nr:hypothetical protein GCM10025861_18270 [Methanobacterium petrolearium]
MTGIESLKNVVKGTFPSANIIKTFRTIKAMGGHILLIKQSKVKKGKAAKTVLKGLSLFKKESLS